MFTEEELIVLQIALEKEFTYVQDKDVKELRKQLILKIQGMLNG